MAKSKSKMTKGILIPSQNIDQSKVQRRLIPLVINLIDNIVINLPFTDDIETSIDSVELMHNDYVVIIKIKQNLNYCCRNILSYVNKSAERISKEVLIFPKNNIKNPVFHVNYEYTVWTEYCNLLTENIAKTINKGIVIKVYQEENE